MATYPVGRTVPFLAKRNKYDLSMLPLGKKYRSHFEIIALILEATREGDEGKFAVMKHASVNCTQLDKFLGSLIEIGFIEMHAGEGRMLCRATEKGLAFLREYYVLLGMLLAPPRNNEISSVVCEPHMIH